MATKLLSVQQASKQFQIGVNKLYEMIRAQPDLPTVKIGRVTRINEELFSEWLNKCTSEGREL